MKQTLLDMTQNILSAMSSDEVNSISDSPEALQVAQIIKNKYFDIIARGSLPEHNQMFQLQPSTDATQPVLMYIPDGVSKVEWIKYYDSLANVVEYKYVTMLPVKQFIDMVNGFNPSESNVHSFSFADTSNGFPGNYTFYYKNDRQPSFCTILSNYYVIFDSYDATQDSTLQASKSMGFGRIVPIFNMVDGFIPDLDNQQFPLLINEAKSWAFYELKQQPHQLALQETKRQWSTVQKNKNINNRPTAFDALPNFGRHGGGFRSGSSAFKDRGWDRS